MIKTPPSVLRRPPRPTPTRRIALDEYYQNDDASVSGMISETTTMASFLMDSSGIDQSPNTAEALRQKQNDARIALMALNQFIFQAGNIYRGKKLNLNEESMLRESANQVGLSMHIVDILLEHTSNPNAVMNYCMTSNDSFATKVKEDPQLAMLLQQDAPSEGGFNLRSSIWRIFMHKILQQVLRDHGLEIKDVMKKSSVTQKLYEEALKSDLGCLESEYNMRAAEREKMHRDYTKERINIFLSEDDIREARQNARSQMEFESKGMFQDLASQENMPSILEGGHSSAKEARDDTGLRVNLYDSPQKPRTPFSPIENHTKQMRTPPSKTNVSTPKSKQNRSSPFSDIRTRRVALEETTKRESPFAEHLVPRSPVIREQMSTKENNAGAPVSAVKRALAMFEHSSDDNTQQQTRPNSTSKVGRGSGSKIAERLALFEKGSQDTDDRLELEPAKSSEHTTIKTSSLFDVFATPQQNKSSKDWKVGQNATTSKISRVKGSQLAFFENLQSDTIQDRKEISPKRGNKLNPEVRRLFDSNPQGSLPLPFVATYPESKENTAKISNKIYPSEGNESLPNRQDQDVVQNNVDSIDAAFDSISDDENSFDDIENLKNGWNSRSTPPTTRRSKPMFNSSPTLSSKSPNGMKGIFPQGDLASKSVNNDKPPIMSQSPRGHKDMFSDRQKGAMNKMLKYAQKPRSATKQSQSNTPPQSRRATKERKPEETGFDRFNSPRIFSEREERFIERNDDPNQMFADEFMASTNENDDVSLASFRHMVGNLGQTKSAIDRVGTGLTSSKTKLEKMYDTLNEVKNEAIDIERSRPEPVANPSLSFFQGIKLSGNKANFKMVPDQNQSTYLNSRKQESSAKKDSHNQEIAQNTSLDEEQWANFDDIAIDQDTSSNVFNNNYDYGPRRVDTHQHKTKNMSAKVEPFNSKTYDHQLDGMATASSLTNSADDESNVFNVFDHKNTGNQNAPGVHNYSAEEKRNSKSYQSKDPSIGQLHQMQQSRGQSNFVSGPSNLEDPDLPAPPSEEEQKLPNAPSASLEIQRSSSSLSRFLKITTTDSEDSDANDIGLNSLPPNRESRNNWDSSAIMQADSPGILKSKLESEAKKAPDSDDENFIRSNAKRIGVPSQVVDIILNQTRKQDPEEDLTSWDAISKMDKSQTRDPSPTAESTGAHIRHHQPMSMDPRDAGFIPDNLPEGASEEDVKLLNRFISLAKSNFDGKKLSAASEARVRKAALKVGLSEGMVDQLIEQARAKNEQRHQYHDSQPDPVSMFPDAGDYVYQASPRGFHNDRRKAHDESENPCSDPCQVLSNLKENLLYFAGCNGEVVDDDSEY